MTAGTHTSAPATPPHRRASKRKLLAGVAAAVVIGGSIGAVFTLSGGSEPSFPPSAAAHAEQPFWALLHTQATETFVPQTLDELAQPADVIVLGRIVGIQDQGASVSSEGEVNGLDRVFLEVKVDRLVDGALPPSAGDVVRVQIFKPSVSPIEQVRATIPTDAQLFVLFNVGTLVTTRGGSPEEAAKYSEIYGSLSSLGIISVGKDGSLIASQEPEMPIDNLTGGSTDLNQLADLLKKSRDACNPEAACLRDVFNPAGASRGTLGGS